MQNIILHDIRGVQQELLPLTYTRTPAHIRLGLDTIGVKWQAGSSGNYYIIPSVDFFCDF